MVLRIAALLFVFCAAAILAQSFEIAGHTGAGGITGEDVSSGGIGAIGASFKPGLPLRIDYQYLIPGGTGTSGMHLFSASWFKEAQAGRTRPFFQAGLAGGFTHYRYDYCAPQPEPRPCFAYEDTDTFYGFAFGAGASVTLSGRFFLRPEIQVKMLGPGPFIIVLPALGAGFRF